MTFSIFFEYIYTIPFFGQPFFFLVIFDSSFYLSQYLSRNLRGRISKLSYRLHRIVIDDIGETIPHVAGINVAAGEYSIERRHCNELWIIFVRAIIIRRQVRYKAGEFFFDVPAFVLAVNFTQHVHDGSLVFFRHAPYFWPSRWIPSLARISDVEDVSQVRGAPMIHKRDATRALFHPSPEGLVPQR
jgi:hypothetical protein